jgi:hypothetical protein
VGVVLAAKLLGHIGGIIRRVAVRGPSAGSYSGGVNGHGGTSSGAGGHEHGWLRAGRPAYGRPLSVVSAGSIIGVNLVRGEIRATLPSRLD